MIPSEQWDVELLLAIRAVPWNWQAAEQRAKRFVFVPIVPPIDVLPPPLSQALPKGDRQVYIRKGIELAKYGMTPGCPGCLAVAAGGRAVAHSKECRERIEAAMEQDTDPRLTEAFLGKNKPNPQARAGGDPKPEKDREKDAPD